MSITTSEPLAFELKGTGPLFAQVAKHYRSKIHSGELPPGTRLPICLELGRVMGLSPQTINRAFDILAKEGLVYRRRSVGTIVGAPSSPGEKPAKAPGRRHRSSVAAIGMIMERRTSGQDEELDLLLADYLNGLIEGATHYRLRFEVIYTSPGQSKAELASSLTEQGNIVGLVNMFLDDTATRILLDRKFPMVGLNINLSAHHVPSVLSDEVHGFADAWKYVGELGHHRAAFLGYETRNESCRYNWAAGREIARSKINRLPCLLIQSDDDVESIRRLLIDQLGPNHRTNRWPTMFFAQTDLLAIRLIEALSGLGIQVPSEVSVIGFNDTSIALSHRPALTTLTKPRRAMAVAAAHLLGNLLAERPGSGDHLQVFPLMLVRRETCMAPPES